MADVVIHIAAEAEYEAALSWYLARSARAAVGFAAAFEKAVENISLSPAAYPECGDGHRWCRLRRYPYGLVFRIDGDQVLVVAIPHDRQLPGYWLGRS